MNTNRYTWVNDHYREIIDGIVRVEVPKQTGVGRWWHANGKLAKEMFLMDGMPDGVCREWHENGNLAREIPYDRGFIDGVVMQWNRDGVLLGSYEMRMGRGTLREWYDDGALKVEIEIIGGGCQRGRIWDDTGMAKEVFVWMDHPVTQTEFIRRASVAARAA